MKNLISRFTNNELANDESGATAIEYGLIAALIAVAIITTITTMSGSLQGVFTRISAALIAA